MITLLANVKIYEDIPDKFAEYKEIIDTEFFIKRWCTAQDILKDVIGSENIKPRITYRMYIQYMDPVPCKMTTCTILLRDNGNFYTEINSI